MKKFKRLISSVVFLAMLLSISFSVMAVDPGTPRVSSVTANGFTLYQFGSPYLNSNFINGDNITFKFNNATSPKGINVIGIILTNPSNDTTRRYVYTNKNLSATYFTQIINMADFNYMDGQYSATFIIYTDYYPQLEFTSYFYYDHSAPRIVNSNTTYSLQNNTSMDINFNVTDLQSVRAADGDVTVNSFHVGSGIRRVRFILNKISPYVVPMDQELSYTSTNKSPYNGNNFYNVSVNTWDYFGNAEGGYRITIYAYDYAGNILSSTCCLFNVINGTIQNVRF